ncbi:MAG: hypothetical protein WED09_07335 [Homoserinimonas sp.]
MSEQAEGRPSGVELRDAYCDAFLLEWIAWEKDAGFPFRVPSDVEKQLEKWRVVYRVPLEQIIEAVGIAWASTADDPWLYFCGVVWNKIRQATAAGFESGRVL